MTLHKLPTDAERAWAAGFLDGEGCWTCSNKPHKSQFGLFATQSGDGGIENLMRLKKVIGFGHVYGPYHPSGNRKNIYRYALMTFEHVQFALCLLWTYMGTVKREQACSKFKLAKSKPIDNKYYKGKKMERNGDI